MEKLDKSKIPKGLYCYTWQEFPSKENNYKGKINLCPYYKCKFINDVKVPWCDYLNAGGTDNEWTDKDWIKIKEHYKTDEAMDKELPLFLLWDCCKECSENLED